METNFISLFVAALIPLVIGALWYNPKMGFGNAWMKASGMTEEKMRTGNMALIFGLTYLFGLFLSFELAAMVIHQNHLFSMLVNEPGFMEKGGAAWADYQTFLEKYGDRFRTFQHGAFHGGFSGLLVALPIIGIVALFERRGFRYIAIHTAYWIVTLALMGGLICAWQ